MKRFISILLLTFYLVANIGVNISLHYCGGSLANISILQTDAANQCACGSQVMEKDCCQTKNLHFELKDKNHKASSFSFSNDLIPKISAFAVAILNFDSAKINETEKVSTFELLPYLFKVPLRIKNQVYRV